jgi:RNA polymerase-binding transcription factor DksA
MEKRFRKDLSSEFIAERKAIIQEHISRYFNRKRIEEEFSSGGDVSPYTLYKQVNVVPQLKKALKAIESGTYGVCIVCGGDIEIERLKKVAGALDCMKCMK